MAFADRLDEAMRKSGISQKRLADIVGLSEMSISRYRKGERQPRSEDIQKIAAALNTTAAYLIGESDDMGAVAEHKGVLVLTGKDFASRLKARREELGLSQRAVAEMTNSAVTQAQISKIERGDSDTTTEVLRELCRVLKVSSSFMMGETDYPSGSPTGTDVRTWSETDSTRIDVPLVSYETSDSDGKGSDALNIIGTYSLFDVELSQNYTSKTLRAITMDGDSMEPKIHDHDTIIFNLSKKVIPGAVFVVMLSGRIFIKGLIPRNHGKSFTLRSCNKEYPDFNADATSDDFAIIGHVLTVITKRTVPSVI